MTVTSSATAQADDTHTDAVATAAPRRGESNRPVVPRLVPNPKIVRPHGLGRAQRPGTVPSPEHRHLPGWVRRAHAQAQPILADLLGQLEGQHQASMASAVDQVVSSISAGRFSQAWAYPRLIADGMRELHAQRREQGAMVRARQRTEAARRRVAEQLRDNASGLPSDTVSRLHRALRSAADADGVAAVGAEVERALSGLRSGESRRRQREIGRTRAQILRTAPRGGEVPAVEPWQETLRRFAEQQAAGGA